MHKSIGYHTRLSTNNTVKICGGSFGGSLDLETVNRLVKHHFTVKAKPSGSLGFVDSEGREVSLYLSVDPEDTEAGILVRAELNRAKAEERHAEARKWQQIAELLDGMSVDEAIQKLS